MVLVARPVYTDDPSCLPKSATQAVLIVEHVPHRGAPYSIGGREYSVDGACFYQTDEIAGANILDIASIYNPANSNRLVVVHRTGIELFANATAGTPLFELCRISVAPTGGTVVSGVKRSNAEGTANAVIRSSPAATDTTDRIFCGFSPAAGSPYSMHRGPPSCPIVLSAGEGLLWHTQDDATNVRISAFFETFEVSK